MAKLIGPFMSLDASGTLADILTASHWKGRNYMRQRVIPANPRTAGQQGVRQILGGIAKACRAVLTSYSDPAFVGSDFFVNARDTAPSGQSWISNLQKVQYGVSDTVTSAWAALDGTHQGYFNTNAPDVGLTDYVNTAINANESAGRQLFELAYFAVNTLGYTGFADFTAPTNAEVVTFNDYVHTSAA